MKRDGVVDPSDVKRDWKPSKPGRFSVESWLVNSVQRRLGGTSFGVSPEHEQPDPVVFDDPLVNQVLKMDIATFLIAERHSVSNTARMIELAPTEADRLFLATQVADEARHFEAFSHRLTVVGADDADRERLMERYDIPQLKALFQAIDEQIDRRDFCGAAMGQNLILEGMAFPVYRYESKYWSRLDPGLSEVIRGAFADEVQHTSFGEAFLARTLREDPTQRAKMHRLLYDFRALMDAAFDAVIRHYIGLYQCAADAHMERLGDIEIFPNRTMSNTSEEEQVRILRAEIEREFTRRAEAIGLGGD